MKNYLKTILLFFVASAVLISCSDDDVTPPTAGFTLSDSEPTQWDEVTITSTAVEAIDITYTITGGDYELNGNIIEFLEAKNYTITQSVQNTGGADTSTLIVEVDPYNTFSLDGEDNIEFTKPPFWVAANPAHRILNAYIRFENPIAGGATVDLFKITPITGATDPLEGTYSFSKTADKGTYKIVHTHNQEGMKYDWTTNGEGGSDLVIKLIKDNGGADNIYDITITSFTLDYGNWDFATFTWVSEGKKTLVFHYRGVISASK